MSHRCLPQGGGNRPCFAGRLAKDPMSHQRIDKGVSMRKLSLTTIALLTLYGATAGAANMAFLNQSILSEIPKGQSKEFAMAVGDALNNVPDGQSSTWTGKPERKNQVPISATFRPRDTVQLDKGRACRLLDTDMRK